MKDTLFTLFVAAVLTVACATTPGFSQSTDFRQDIYPTQNLKPVDSTPILKVGGKAPDFTLPAIYGGKVSLSQFRGRKNTVISFVPAAWTPVCSDQWPGYNISEDLFKKNDTVLIGITVDNIPTLYAWTRQMSPKGLWFPVLSDFYPHGAVASKYGVLRTDGTSERALFVIDKQGIIRYIDVHDINKRPLLEDLAKAMEEANKGGR